MGPILEGAHKGDTQKEANAHYCKTTDHSAPLFAHTHRLIALPRSLMDELARRCQMVQQTVAVGTAAVADASARGAEPADIHELRGIKKGRVGGVSGGCLSGADQPPPMTRGWCWGEGRK